MSEQAHTALEPAPGGMGPHVRVAGGVPWGATWVMLAVLAAVVNTILIAAVHGVRGFFIPVLAALLCVLAAMFDGWTRRIPNPLTYTAILVGVGINAWVPLLERMHASSVLVWLGGPGLQASVLGFALCAGLGVAGALVAGIHGGDLKLLAAVGALVGFSEVCSIALLALGMALLYALLNLMLLGRLNAAVRIAGQRALELMYLRQFRTPVPEADKPTHIPMAIPLAVAAVVAVYMRVRYGAWSVL